MQQKEIRFRKTRDLGAIITDSFDFLKQEIKPISRILLVYVLPFVVLYAGAQIYMQRNVLSRFDLSNTESIMANIGPFYSNLFIFMLFGTFINSLLVGTYYSYLEAYIKQGKGNFTLQDISSHFFHNSLLALGAGLIFTAATFLGIFMCFLPGIYIANTLSLIAFIVIFEKKGISYAISKSWQLVNSQWWNTLALNIVALLMIYAIGTLLSLPTLIFGFSTGIFAPADVNLADFPNWYWAWTALTSIITTMLSVIPVTFLAFQYFNLEERENPQSQS
ncbi:hypothetical protein [Maribellus sp. YY47]|uniref:hypothetical protein n=1 Tax=Maribellus sp. YY47 TaxID=2929486 RepID=UPI0020007C4B|nr:hypothetical protein [Maribellus sp. YY47]MCK3684202.1 hypothetical protein [Maribellus sp. YY47]